MVELLRQAREKAGISQVELAAKLGRNQSYVSKSERGAQGIEVDELIDYCRAVGVKPGDVLNGLEDFASILLKPSNDTLPTCGTPR